MALPDNVHIFPAWKENSTTAEFFAECSLLAEKYPERFGKVVLIYEETLEDGSTKIRYISQKATTVESIGLLHMGAIRILENTSR